MTDYGPAAARKLDEALYDPASTFMLSEATAEIGKELGFDGPIPFYLAGRHGVLGDTTPEVLAAAHGFLSPDAAGAMWPGVGEVADRAAAAEAFARACAEHGENHLTGLSETDAVRLAELAERVVEAAPATALFAAWRAMPLPDSPRARAMHLLNLLREWRGGVHISAVNAAGLTPLEAIMAHDNALFYAEVFGWPKPWPEQGGKSAEMAEVSAAVDAACGRVIADTISAEEADELVALAARAAELLA